MGFPLGIFDQNGIKIEKYWDIKLFWLLMMETVRKRQANDKAQSWIVIFENDPGALHPFINRIIYGLQQINVISTYGLIFQLFIF